MLPGVHVVPLTQGAATPGGTMNVSVLVDGDDITVVDAGLPGDQARIVEYLGTIGKAPEEVGRIIVTHHHADHVGGLAELVRLTGAEVWAHHGDAAVVDGSEPRAPIPPERIADRLAGIPAEQRAAAEARLKQMAQITPAAVDLRLVGGEELGVLGGVRILHTPGHTPGHLVLFLPALSLLIGGDLLRLTEGVIRESPPGFAADVDQALASARASVALGFDAFIGYHGDVVSSGAAGLLAESLTRAD